MAFLGDGEKMWTWRGRKDKMGGEQGFRKNLKNRRQLLDTSRNRKDICIRICYA